MTKIHQYFNEGVFGTSWHILDPVLTEELRKRVLLKPDEVLFIQNIEVNGEKQGIIFEYHVHKETEVDED